jgi:hypothetical protein
MEDASDNDLLEKSSETAKSLREAYTLARFAAGIRASDCRLVNDQFPDAEIRTHDKIKKLELTELMAPNRKRGAEYKSGAIYHEPQTLTSGNWIYRFVELVFKKSDYYGHSMHCDLVIDNNQVFLSKLPEHSRLHSLLIKEL